MTLSFNADRETKKLTRKQVEDLETANDLETIKQNSPEPQKFKRVSLMAGMKYPILNFTATKRMQSI